MVISKAQKDNLKHLIGILREMDGLIIKLRKDDQIYGDLWQNFTDCCKVPNTKELIKILENDLKK